MNLQKDYDKLSDENKTVTEELKNLKEAEEQAKAAKLTEEEVLDLESSLLINGGYYGLYFNKKVTIDNINSFAFSKYVFNKYVYDKDIVINDNNREVVITQSDLNNYVKEKFNTDREFVYNDNGNVVSQIYPNDKGCGMAAVTYKQGKYYIESSGWSLGAAATKAKLVRYEQHDDYVDIYDKFVSCSADTGNFGCDKAFYLNRSSNGVPNELIFVDHSGVAYDRNKNKVIPNGAKYFNIKKSPNFVDFDSFFKDFNSRLNTYKHTFKKGADGNYYWYSSEVVNK